MSGKGFVRPAPHVRLIEHRACAYCKKLGPACLCGRLTWMNEPRTVGGSSDENA